VPLNKKGSPQAIKVIKKASFTIDENFLAEIILKQVHTKKLSVDQLHSALKSVGVDGYDADDFNVLVDRLQSSGFDVKV
jgi:hypothetical protein